MRKSSIFVAIFVAIFLSGCIKQPEVYNYSEFLQSRPRSILVLMPTNESMEPNGSSAVLANTLYPLSEAGYYVFPPALVNDTFKYNGVYEAGEIHQISLNKLKQIFNADAVLYLNVKRYGNTYMVTNSVTEVTVHAKLVDINNGKMLWEKEASAMSNSGGGNDIVGMLISALVTQIANTATDAALNVSATADVILFATDCNNCILAGPRSPKFGKDIQLNSSK